MQVPDSQLNSKVEIPEILIPAQFQRSRSKGKNGQTRKLIRLFSAVPGINFGPLRRLKEKYHVNGQRVAIFRYFVKQQIKVRLLYQQRHFNSRMSNLLNL